MAFLLLIFHIVFVGFCSKILLKKVKYKSLCQNTFNDTSCFVFLKMNCLKKDQGIVSTTFIRIWKWINKTISSLKRTLSIQQLETQVSWVKATNIMCSSYNHFMGTQTGSRWPKKEHRDRAEAITKRKGRRRGGKGKHGSPHGGWNLRASWSDRCSREVPAFGAMMEISGCERARCRSLQIWLSSIWAPSGSRAVRPVPNLNKRNPQLTGSAHL